MTTPATRDDSPDDSRDDPDTGGRGGAVRPPALLAMGWGIAAAALGTGLGHLAAGIVRPDASPVLAVGSVMIDTAPTPLKSWAIRTFGAQDKVVLLAGIAAATLVFAALAGLLARRSAAAGATALTLLAGLATAAALTRPTASVASVIPGIVTGIAGVGALLFLSGRSRNSSSSLNPHSADPPDHPASAPARRTLLRAGGLTAGLALVGAAAGAAGQRLTAGAQKIATTLPAPLRRLPALPAGLDRRVRGITPLLTPQASFYRVDTALTVPAVDAADWKLIIDGDVERPLTFSYQDLLDMPLIERDVTLTCVSNEVGGPYAGGARWTGIPVRDLLAMAKPRPGNDQVLSTSVDGYTCSTPLAALQDQRLALLAVGMNGKPLPRKHGYPARLVTPGLYGFVGATKWVTRLTVTTYAERSAYWTDRKWVTDAPIKPMARIDTPEPLVQIPAGREVAIGGTAWAQQRGITAVEVQIDDGPWKRAQLGPQVNIDYWRQWWLPWTPTAGQHRIRARCIDGTGAVQTAATAAPFPSGASGYHDIVVIAS